MNEEAKDKLIEELLARIYKLEIIVVVVEQAAKIKVLEEKLSKNSNNSSKPPSSDGLKKEAPKPRSLRQKSNKKPGGQKGHKGHTLKQVDMADTIIKHEVLECNDCKRSLKKVPCSNVLKRQVFDVPQPRFDVTEHQIEIKNCPHCKTKQIADYPKDIVSPAQYGNNIKSMVVYLRQYQLLPEKRLQTLFLDLFNIKISKATIASIHQKTYKNLKLFEKKLLKEISTSKLVHLDETGFRVMNKTRWLHVAGNTKWTYYHVSEKRKSLLKSLTGTLVHDHWKPYFQFINCEHVLCNAHHLRELNALIEIKELWAHQMKRWLLFSLNLKYHHAPNNIPVKKRIKLFKLFDEIILLGLKYHRMQPDYLKKKKKQSKTYARAKGHNLVRRLRNFKQETTLFMMSLDIPFTNNLAEQDLRMMKVQQKISGCFRSWVGAQIFARIRSFISTARKQGWDIFSTIKHAVKGSHGLNYYIKLHNKAIT